MNWCWGSVLQYRNLRRWKSHGWGSHDVERMFVPYQSVADGVGSFWQPHACNTDYAKLMWVVTGIRGCNGKYYCKGKKFCVYGTFLRLTPTSPSPTFDQHRSSLFFSSTEKNESSIPPKSRLLILKCRPFMKLFTIFAMQSHGGNIKKCDCIVRFFLHTPVALQSENQALQKNATTMLRTEITEPGSKSRAEHRCFVNSDDAPAQRTIKARCPKPPIVL